MHRRQFLMAAAASALLPGTVMAAAPKAPPEAPMAAIRPKHITQLGRTRVDNYAWLRDPNYSEFLRGTRPLDADITTHLNAENAYASAILKPTQTRQDQYKAAMMALVGAPKSHAAAREATGEWTYYTYIRPGEDHLVHARKPARGGAEQILLDEQARSKGQSYYRVIEAQPSPDQSLFVWAEDLKGSDRHRICVHDLKTGDIRTWEDGYGWMGLTVSADSQWVFWIWRDAFGRPAKVFRTAARGDTAQTLVYEETSPALFVSIGRMASDAYNFIHISGPDLDEWRLIPAKAPAAAPVLMKARQPGLHYEVVEWNGQLVISTDDGGAIDGQLMTATGPDAAWQAWRPAKDGVHILSVTPFREALTVRQRNKGRLEIVIVTRDGTSKTIAFDEPAYDVTLAEGQAFDSKALRLVYQSPRTPPRQYDVDMASGVRILVEETVIPGFDPAAYDVLRLEAPTTDNETVPLTVLIKKGTPRDGSAPLLLYGYGSYGLSSEAEFSIPALALVDQGFVYAIAHVRGGSEKGRRWFLDGRRFKKANSFIDFNVCAEHLVRKNYTRKGKVVAYGLSAGGLLVGGAMNRRPDLYAGVIAQVPFVDMLNTMSDATHPLVPAFRPDWGDPLAAPEAYDYIASISPYENVKKAAYPMVLATAGVRDDRVSYWEPAKWISALRVKTTSKKPILFKVNMTAGHQSASGLSDVFGQMAMFWAFAELSLKA